MSSTVSSTILVPATLFLVLNFADCENILVLCPLSVRSHKSMFEPIVSLLDERGHEVTIVSAWKPTKVSETIREVVALNGFEYFPNVNILKLRRDGKVNPTPINHDYVEQACRTLYHYREFVEMVDYAFDLVLLDPWLMKCLLGFVDQVGAPFMYLTAPSKSVFRTFPGITDEFFASPDPANEIAEEKKYESIYRTYLGKNVSGIAEIHKKVSVMFVNAYFGVNEKLDHFRNVFDISGYHCRPGNPLPQDLEEFVSSNEDGFILLSFGSVLKLKDIPKSILQAFLNVFRKLKQNVVWKVDKKLKNLPSNIRTLKWIPQQDLLAHKKIRMFITHGGLQSTQEAIYHGVPVVGFPICSDQDFNMQRVHEAKIGINLEILNVTEQILNDAIQTILEDKSYADRMTMYSKKFRKETEYSLEQIAFWIEHVMRNFEPGRWYHPNLYTPGALPPSHDEWL